MSDGDLPSLAGHLTAALAGREDVSASAGLLERRGLGLRVLAASAPALLDALETIWTRPRHTLWGGAPPAAAQEVAVGSLPCGIVKILEPGPN
ncbi:MAG TPA: hypothetical protein VLD61_06015 [Methylomirabilota bacterium]|nr:hypothetical protein [Methylomirabilota bacterium]